MKPETIKGILIDPVTKTVTEIELEKNSEGLILNSLYSAIGCDLVDMARISEMHGMFIDDEGFLVDNPAVFGFDQGKHGRVAYAGKAVIVGLDNEGGTTSHSSSVKRIQEFVTFDLQNTNV